MSMDYFDGADYDWNEEVVQHTVPAAEEEMQAMPPPWMPSAFLQSISDEINTSTPLQSYFTQLWGGGLGFNGTYFTTAPASMSGTQASLNADPVNTYQVLTRSPETLWSGDLW